ncbi:MAG: GNAT family N-acetyltransferase [Xanthomonadaceae bacterium]|jgi:phosphinothricin acetyltransferase|nr:GNAT family N-acetyltransferase [Xanthomonadaceae bacterium]
MDPIIRNAVLADVPAITALYADEVRNHIATYEHEVPDEAEMERRMHGIQTAGYPYLVAEADGLFLGYAYACAYRSRSGYRWTVEDTVYVAPEAQYRGIGKALLAKLIEICEERGFRQMVAVIGEPANSASIALHEQLGFRIIGIFPGLGHKHGRWLDTVQMQRALGSGNRTPPSDE